MFVPARIAVALALCLATAFAAVPILPALDGELQGDADVLPGAPALHWTIVAREAKPTTLHAILVAQGEGTQLRVEIDVDRVTGDAKWKIADGVVDARHWVAALAQPFDLGDLTATGQIQIAGHGSIQHGVPSGTIQVSWPQGTLSNEKGGWTFEGVSVEAELAFDWADHTIQSTSPARLKITTIAAPRFGARNLSIVTRLLGDRILAVESATIEIAGGTASLVPCRLPLQPFDARIEVNFSRVGLQDIAQFFPELIRTANGRVDGKVRLHWSQATELEIGSARVTLSKNEKAEIRLAPRPGLLSPMVSDDINPLVKDRLKQALQRIETGQAPLRVDDLDLTLTPHEDVENRTGRIDLSGAPMEAGIIAPIVLGVNLRGPLDVLLPLWTGTKLRFAE